MSTLANVFGGGADILPHVTWPIIPRDRESLAGFTDRTCNHNALPSPVLLADAGARLPKGLGYLARSSRNLASLATLLNVDASWVEDRRHTSVKDSAGGHHLSINFHGAKLRRVHLDYSVRRVAPTAIEEDCYHREIWHVFTLGACAATGELLVEACQRPDCGKPFGWSGHRSVGSCADPECEATAASLTAAVIRETIRASFNLAAALVDPAARVNRSALESLPKSLQAENRGDLFELAWLLGCLDHIQGPKAIMSPALFAPATRCEVLARGTDRLMAWPECLDELLRGCALGVGHDTSLKLIVKTVQTIIRQQTTFGRSSILIGARFERISTNSFSSVVGQHLTMLTATQFVKSAGLTSSGMAVMRRSTHLPRVLFSEGARDIALFSPADAADIRTRAKSRLSVRAFAADSGLGIDAIELLIGENILSKALDPIVEALWPEPHLDRVIADALWERITQRVRRDPAPVGSVPLSIALHGCPAGEKPWPSIIGAMLAGRLNLHHTDKGKLNFRSCLISRPDARLLQTLRLSRACPVPRSEWMNEPDARERLSTTGHSLRSLAAAGRLTKSGSFSGQTYRRSEINEIAAAWVSTLELQAKLGQTSRRELSRILATVGLVADEHRLVSRVAAREKLVPFLVSPCDSCTNSAL
ncbi:hypothetical protein FHT02_003126 [Sphingomonas xinjiangensis]|uniref:TniQ protein n=1 Tax=Sphingomonas xinjiangensis TaxID=643568 RepID=A0A840YGA5_9SPHN|nr:hypothetical protein [Sphingomonas xinjiangensis]